MPALELTCICRVAAGALVRHRDPPGRALASEKGT